MESLRNQSLEDPVQLGENLVEQPSSNSARGEKGENSKILNSNIGRDQKSVGGSGAGNILMLEEIKAEIGEEELEEDDEVIAPLVYQMNEIECRMTDIDENEESSRQSEPFTPS